MLFVWLVVLCDRSGPLITIVACSDSSDGSAVSTETPSISFVGQPMLSSQSSPMPSPSESV